MARAIWKGAISFGLVHIPVAVVSATSARGIDFDWLDKRSMDPVGYKRVNTATGEEVTKENIVKGIAYEKGNYVVLSEEEIRTAHPKSTQTIDIFAFVEQVEIPLENIVKPYYLAPDRRGEKVYALLREALIGTGKVALAQVVLHSRQHLAALMPIHSALVLILLRWPAEVRSLDTLDLDDATVNPTLTKSEMEMAKRLVTGMTAQWRPQDYHDTFQEKILQLVENKARAGKIEQVERPDAAERRSADVIDLMDLLKRSLRGETAARRASAASASDSASDSASPGKSRGKKKPAQKTPKQDAGRARAPTRKKAAGRK